MKISWQLTNANDLCGHTGAIALAASLPFLPKLKVGTGEELNRHGIFFGVPGRLDIYIYIYIHIYIWKDVKGYIYI